MSTLAKNFADHFHYREYQRLLVELHGLIAAGRNQLPEARSLRQNMETHEGDLSEDEIVRLNELSSDLSMIHDREIPDPEVLARVSRDNIPLQIKSAFTNQDWKEVLQLLRAGVTPHFWQPSQLAYIRSRAYEGLGELTPAIAFMDEAAKREPGNVNFRALALRLLWENERYNDAFNRAHDYLADSNTKPRLVLMSGGIVAQRSMQSTLPIDLITIANIAFKRMLHALPKETSPNIAFAGNVALGLLAVLLDNTTAATDAFNAALIVGTEEHFTSNPVLTRELEFLRSGKSKTAEERANARQLAENATPVLALVNAA